MTKFQTENNNESTAYKRPISALILTFIRLDVIAADRDHWQ